MISLTFIEMACFVIITLGIAYLFQRMHVTVVFVLGFLVGAFLGSSSFIRQVHVANFTPDPFEVIVNTGPNRTLVNADYNMGPLSRDEISNLKKKYGIPWNNAEPVPWTNTEPVPNLESHDH